LIWKFDPRIDHLFTRNELNSLPKVEFDYIIEYSCLYNDLFIFDGDNGRYFNHSDTPNTMMYSASNLMNVVIVAKSDLDIGVELTCDYRMICDDVRNNLEKHKYIKR